MNDLTDISASQPDSVDSRRGVEFAGIIDELRHAADSDLVYLIMVEPRPWDGSDLQLFQLQEKLNAYLSFILDGEMNETYPILAGKKVTIELHCATVPDAKTVNFLRMVREQISYQEIDLQVRAASMGPASPGQGGCGSGCGCGA